MQKATGNWPKRIMRWLKRGEGRTLTELARQVADRMGDNPARVLASVSHWRAGRRTPTGRRREALEEVLDDAQKAS